MQKGYFGNFPYKATIPSSQEERVYKNIDDVYEELEKIYDRNAGKGNGLGESLYLYSNFIVDNAYLVDSYYQTIIKEYYYSKVSKTPPYPSVKDTPNDYMDKFIIIDQETNEIAKESEKK